MPSFQSFQQFPHQQLFFDLKDKNYKNAKMKGGLGWMKNIVNDPRSLFDVNHFSSRLINAEKQLHFDIEFVHVCYFDTDLGMSSLCNK